MISIYIVGAQCTGKTTLTQAVALRLQAICPELKIAIIQEMARSVLERHHFTREDIRKSSSRCISLQKLILDAQYDREKNIDPETTLISDRSGIDPLAYASMFARDQSIRDLSDSVP
jgi:predicted ATPase